MRKSSPELAEALRQGMRDFGASVIDDGTGPGRGTLMMRVGDSLSTRVLFEAGTAYLPGFEPRPRFVF